MADQVTQVTYYMGEVPNKTGEAAHILKAMNDAGVNLVGFLGYPKSARKSEIVLVVDEKAPNLGPIAKKAGVALGKKQKALLVMGEDRQGAGAELAVKLAGAGINLVSMHAVSGGAGRYGVLIAVVAADFRKAAKALAG
jgi:hypothetical protein